MINKKLAILVLLTFLSLGVKAQIDTTKKSPHKFEFDGQASAYTSYSPKNDLDMFIGGRYLPELNYSYTFKNESMLDFETSANMYGSVLFQDRKSVV